MASASETRFMREIQRFLQRTTPPIRRAGLDNAAVMKVAGFAPEAAKRLAKSWDNGASRRTKAEWERIEKLTVTVHRALGALVDALGEDGFHRFAPASRSSFNRALGQGQPLLISRRVRAFDPNEAIPSAQALLGMLEQFASASAHSKRSRLAAADNIKNNPDREKDSYAEICLDFFFWMTGRLPGRTSDPSKSPFAALLNGLWDDAHDEITDFTSTLRRLRASSLWATYGFERIGGANLEEILRSGPGWVPRDALPPQTRD
jgi:hypothetical protein